VREEDAQARQEGRLAKTLETGNQRQCFIWAKLGESREGEKKRKDKENILNQGQSYQVNWMQKRRELRNVVFTAE